MSQPARKSSAAPNAISGPVRLQKLLAASGLASRRGCEQWILAGRVEVDGRVVSELGAKADPARQEIRVDGVLIARPKLVYFAVHKPPGVVSTNRDPAGRPRVVDLVPYGGRLFTVGRLDMSSEGLILVTNDGALADRLTHPRYGVEKTYRVEVAGRLAAGELARLRRGIHLAEGRARPVSLRVIRSFRHSTLLEIVLAEGKNREIRRILARLEHKVERLRRIAIGPVRLADLPSGAARPLEPDELRRLKRAARSEHKRARREARVKPPPPAAPRRTIIGGAEPSRSVRPVGAARPRGRRPGRAARVRKP